MSITGRIDHFVFTDSTGVEYRLDQKLYDWWASKEGIYLAYDAATKRLYFRDGSSWEMGVVSAGTEQDAGTRYPSLMQDSNGNQVRVRYQSAVGVGWTNSSARISQIEDVRAACEGTCSTYFFWFNNDAVPHLTNIWGLCARIRRTAELTGILRIGFSG